MRIQAYLTAAAINLKRLATALFALIVRWLDRFTPNPVFTSPPKKADTLCAERAAACPWSGHELFDRSGTSTPVRTTTSPSMASSAVGPNDAQQQKGRREPLCARPRRTLV
jgi:hypothetical protein